MIHDKKGQLRLMEFKYFFFGFILGLLISVIAFIVLYARGVLAFSGT